MLENHQINRLLGIDESYQSPQKMMDILLDDKERIRLFKEFLKIESDLNYEWFQSYFESEHSDRKIKKQDFTPMSISFLCASLIGESKEYFEAAAGTGGMMIQAWNFQQDRIFIVEELSDRSIPFLIFNMAIRNMDGIVRHGDSLTRKFKKEYHLKRGEIFSSII